MDLIIFHTLGLLVVAICVAIVARRVRLPYTVGLVAAGIGLAYVPSRLDIRLTEELIFDVILPPLLFEAALCLHWEELRRDAPPVMLLATVGVVISACVVAAGLVRLAGCGDGSRRGHCHVQGHRRHRPHTIAGGKREPAE